MILVDFLSKNNKINQLLKLKTSTKNAFKKTENFACIAENLKGKKILKNKDF